jgi:phosphate transport system protein
MGGIMREEFQRELNNLTDKVLQLSSMVDLAIANAMLALKTGDQTLAQQIITDDEKINHLRFEVEEGCYLLISKQQPVASDLRTIMTAENIALELERMGDHAKGIAIIVQRMEGEPPLKPLVDLPQMAEISRQMLRQSLDAFVARDMESAKAIAPRDEEVDHLYTEIFHELVTILAQKPDKITQGM